MKIPTRERQGTSLSLHNRKVIDSCEKIMEKDI
jgi:hypothetical protein